MKTAIVALTISFIMVHAAPALAAGDHGHGHGHNHDAEERIEHYAVEKPADKTAALSLLDKKTAEVAAVVKKGNLSDSDLGKIHEISYSLEASVDKLRETQEGNQEAALDTLDEAVQAIHYASENHEVEKIRTWLSVFETSSKEVLRVF